MTTPEMRALVTGFSSWEEPSEAAGQKKAEGQEELETAVWLFGPFVVIFFYFRTFVLVPWFRAVIGVLKKKSLSDVEMHR